MINTKDVVTMRIPFPTIKDKLAYKSHMYICMSKNNHNCEFVKCQTLKPKMLYSNLIKHYVDEKADINRNPFKVETRIDCDKIFFTNDLIFNTSMKTSLRPDVCQPLFDSVATEVAADGYMSIILDNSEMLSINMYITSV